MDYQLSRFNPPTKKNIISIVVFLILLADYPVSASWETSYDIDQGNNLGLYPSMYIQTDDQSDNVILHISYFDAEAKELKYAKVRNGEVKSRWEMDYWGNAGKYNSLALDSSNCLHVSYYDEDTGNLKYVFYDNKWLLKKIILDSEGDVGLYTSIAVDGNDKPHISYYDKTNGDLKYYNGDTEQTTVVDSEGDVGLYSSIAVHNDNDNSKSAYYISYYDTTNGYLKCASSLDAVTWNIETVDQISNAGKYSSLVLDRRGFPHIAYYDEQLNALKYARFDGYRWQSSIVVAGIFDLFAQLLHHYDRGLYCSMKLDSQDNPHISFYNANSAQINYAYFNGIRWHVEQPYDVPYSGPYSCLALDNFDRPYIAFYSSIEKPQLER